MPLKSKIQNFCSLNKKDLDLLKESVFRILNKHAPIRKKILSCKQSPFHS